MADAEISASEDVKMEDAHLETEFNEEELLQQKRIALLQKVNTQSFQWTYLTDDVVQSIDTSVPELAEKIRSDLSIATDLFYEILYSAKYFSDRVPIEKLGQILILSVNVKDPSPLFFEFVSAFNTLQVDEQLSSLIRSFRVLTSQALGKYLRDDILVTKFNCVLDYAKNKSEYLFKNFVEQKRYNLLVESSEGYSKLIAFLLEVFDSEDTYFMIDYTLRNIDALIGHYSLDPVRVLDILFDISSNFLLKNYRFCFDLLKKSRWWPIGLEADNSSLETLDKGGSKIGAKLLGAKLRFYEHQKREVPETLRLYIALLIKEGFISFGSIYKDLSPTEDDMKKLEQQVAEKIDNEIFKASANALALSGPLADEEEEDKPKSGSATKAEKDESESNLSNNKLSFLIDFLSIGLYWPSIYILSRYPFLVSAHKDVIPLLLRLFEQAIEPLKIKLDVLTENQHKELTIAKKTALARGSEDSILYENYTLTLCEVFRPLQQSFGTKKLIFFYREWLKGIPKIENYNDLMKVSNEILTYVGATIGDDLQLLTLLSRFAVDDLNSSEGELNYDEKLNSWFEYLRKFIFPASAVADENPLTSFEMYELLKKFPIQWRYNLYGELLNVTSKNNNFLRLHYSKAEKQTKDLLKRITIENVKPMMRRLAKISFSNPLPSFLVVISQVESYDNLSNLLVDAARYFTDYAWDVLPFVLLVRLTAKRNAVQSDGLNEALWLQSLATFIAKLAKRYASMNLAPILTYIVKAFYQNNLVGLPVLREIVNQMGGIQMTSNLSSIQIRLLNSGEHLQKITYKVILDKREDCINSGKRLVHSLISSNYLSELFILLCNYHRSLTIKENHDSHYKVISNQTDDVASVLHTFTELINYFSNDEPEIFEEGIVSLKELIYTYNIEVPWAFELWRNKLETVDLGAIDYPDVNFENLDKNLYSNFWKLSLYDIHYDEQLYDQEANKLRENIRTLDEHLAAEKRKYSSQREYTKEGKLQKERDTVSEILEGLLPDKEVHKSKSREIQIILSKSRETWFKSEEPSINEIESFYQYCIFPRAIHSSSDAVFTADFLTEVMKLELSSKLVDYFFEADILDTVLYTVTPLEAENLGIFFSEVFRFYETVRKDSKTSVEIKALVFKWNKRLLDSIKVNIENENYMSRKNCFTFLKNLIGVYPVINDHGEEIIDTINRAGESETREDLKLTSNAILAHITSQSKKWISSWEFYEFSEEETKIMKEKREQVILIREEEKQEKIRARRIKEQEELAARRKNMEVDSPQGTADIENSEADSNSTGDATSKSTPGTEYKEEKSDGPNADEVLKEGITDVPNAEEHIKTESNHIDDSNSAIETSGVENDAEHEEVRLESDSSVKADVALKIEDKESSTTTLKPGSKDDEDSAKVEEKTSKHLNSAAASIKVEDNRKRDRFGNIAGSDRRERGKLQSNDSSVSGKVINKTEHISKLKSVEESVKRGDLQLLLREINDPSTVAKIHEAEKSSAFLKQMRTVLFDYGKSVAESDLELSRFKTEISDAILKFPLPRANRQRENQAATSSSHPPHPPHPSTARRTPLPPQESVTRFSNRSNDKRARDPRPAFPSGPSASRRRQPQGSYRNANASANSNASEDSSTYAREGGTKRAHSTSSHNYREKRPRR